MGWELTAYQLSMLSMWVFITHTAIAKDNAITFEGEETNLLTNVSLLPKPTFLTKWTNLDWQFYILSIYSVGTIHFDLPATHTTVVDIIANNNAVSWIKSFEAYFGQLDDDGIDRIHNLFYRHLISSSLFKVHDETVFLLPTIDTVSLTESFPEYMRIFDEFWDSFHTQNAIYSGEHFRQKSLMLCANLTPFSEHFPKINVHYYSGNAETLDNYLKERIRSHFLNKFDIAFVATPEAANVIISSRRFPKEQLLDKQRFVMINTIISNIDFVNIENAMLQTAGF